MLETAPAPLDGFDMSQHIESKKTHYRSGSLPVQSSQGLGYPPAVANDQRSGSITYTSTKPFMSSSASSLTGTSIRTELDGSVIFHPDEDHAGKRYWEGLFQPERTTIRRIPSSLTPLDKTVSNYSLGTPQSVLPLPAIDRSYPREIPNVSRYEILSSIKELHSQDQLPLDKKQFEKMIDQEKHGLNDRGDTLKEEDLKAIYSMTKRKDAPSVLEDGGGDLYEEEPLYGKWYFWFGFLCPILWIVGGTYPCKGRKTSAFLLWRRRNRAALTVFMTLLITFLIIGLVLKPNFLGVRNSFNDSASPSQNPPNGAGEPQEAVGSDELSSNAPVNAADIPDTQPDPQP
ncbi:hypothetical protein INT43_007584 [Umbelopsis isabellina]|uniref:Uncharacterized protein n=1 Tax=Mortierella isabellina TaxID=91625 RepID=A0A8H7UBL7_MORIS|nr:hypothetical protein INT43_007584 [Umbelopsis isabellina]